MPVKEYKKGWRLMNNKRHPMCFRFNWMEVFWTSKPEKEFEGRAATGELLI
jgi:hypothetical protein